MSVRYEEANFDFDFDFLNPGSNISVVSDKTDKPEKPRKAILVLKKKIIATDSLIRRYYEKRDEVEQFERALQTSKEECKQTCLEFKNITEKYNLIEKEAETLRHTNVELQEQYNKTQNLFQAIQSHANQLQILVRENETTIDGLTKENLLQKANVKDSEKNVLNLEKENADLIKDICLMRDIICGKKKLNRRRKLILKKYEKCYTSDDDGTVLDDDSDTDFDSNCVLSPGKVQNERTESTIKENTKDPCVTLRDDNEHDSDSSNELASRDTGRGSSLAFSDGVKCFNSPNYFLQYSPINEKEKNNYVDAATSPIQSSQDILNSSSTVSNIETIQIVFSPINKEEQNENESAVEKEIIPNVVDQEYAQNVIGTNDDKLLKPIPCKNLSESNIVENIPTVVSKSIFDVCDSPEEDSLEAIPIITVDQYEATSSNECADSETIGEKECLDQFDETNTGDCEIEMILNKMRFNRTLITPIPSTPSKSRTASSLRDRGSKISHRGEYVCKEAVLVKEENKILLEKYNKLEQDVAFIKDILKNRFTFNDLQSHRGTILDKEFNNCSNTENLHENIVPCTDSIEPFVNEQNNIHETTTISEAGLMEVEEQPIQHTVSPILPILNSSPIQDNLNNSVLDIGHEEHTYICDKFVAPQKTVENTDNEEHILHDKVTSTKPRKLSKLDKLRNNLVPRSKIKRHEIPNIHKKCIKPKPLPLLKKVINESDSAATLNNKSVYEKAVQIMSELKSQQKSAKAKEHITNNKPELNASEANVTAVQEDHSVIKKQESLKSKHVCNLAKHLKATKVIDSLSVESSKQTNSLAPIKNNLVDFIDHRPLKQIKSTHRIEYNSLKHNETNESTKDKDPKVIELGSTAHNEIKDSTEFERPNIKTHINTIESNPPKHNETQVSLDCPSPKQIKASDINVHSLAAYNDTADPVECPPSKQNKTKDINEHSPKRHNETVDSLEYRSLKPSKTIDVIAHSNSEHNNTADPIDGPPSKQIKVMDINERRSLKHIETTDSTELTSPIQINKINIIENIPLKQKDTTNINENRSPKLTKSDFIERSPPKNVDIKNNIKCRPAKQSKLIDLFECSPTKNIKRSFVDRSPERYTNLMNSIERSPGKPTSYTLCKKELVVAVVKCDENSNCQIAKSPSPKKHIATRSRNKYIEEVNSNEKKVSDNERKTSTKIPENVVDSNKNVTAEIQNATRKRQKHDSVENQDVPCKRILRSSNLRQSTSEDTACANSCSSNKVSPEKSKSSDNINVSPVVIPSLSDKCVNYGDLDMFSNDTKPNTKNVTDHNKQKPVNTKEIVFCVILDKYGKQSRKNYPKKVPDSVISSISKTLQDEIIAISAMNSNDAKIAMNKLVDTIHGWDFKQFMTAFIVYLKDPQRKVELFNKISSPPAPPMTKSEQILLYVISQLKVSHTTIDILNCILCNIEYVLFKLNRTPEFDTIESMAHFYAVLCRYFKMKSRLRLFMLDAMYCIQFKAVPLIKQCLDVWMHVLPLAHMGIAKSPLVTCLVYLLHFYKCEDRFNRVQEIRNILSRKYFYEITEWNEPKIIEMFRNAIKDIRAVPVETKLLRIALIVISKRHGYKWCQKNIVKNLLIPMLEKDVPERVKIFCFSMLGPLLKPYPVDMKVHCEIVFNLLMDTLKQNPSPQIQEAIVSSLIYMSKHNQTRLLQILLTWKPQRVSPRMETMLRDFVMEKPLKVWKAILSKIQLP